MSRVAHASHLVARFFSSLRPRPLDDAERVWARALLTAEERPLFDALSTADQREAVDVARAAAATLAGRANTDTPNRDLEVFLAAALLHDVGKTPARLGPLRRAGATVTPWLVGRARVVSWARRGAVGESSPELKTRLGVYVDHAEIGREMLRAAGARPEPVVWAGAHHDPRSWDSIGIPEWVCEALASADGEVVVIDRRR